MVEHAVQKTHVDTFYNDINTLSKKGNYGKLQLMIKETIEIAKCPVNKIHEWEISNAWEPIIHRTKRKNKI